MAIGHLAIITGNAIQSAIDDAVEEVNLQMLEEAKGYLKIIKEKDEAISKLLKNEVKPEGVGEWRKELRHVWNYGECELSDIEEYVSNLLLQEKAKWKGKINERFVEIVNQNTDCKRGMFRDYIEGLDKAKQELLTLIDKL